MLDKLKHPLVVAYRSVRELAPYARNPRTHTEAQVSQITRSMQQFGWTNPILVDERNTIIAGHGRLEAARKLGMADVPTITLTGLTAAQKRALVIADNQLALNAGWDADLLAAELGELGADGFDLSLIGFSDEELASILADRTDGLTDPDEVPETPADPVSRLGDVWTLGRHRLVCGDATSEVDVSLALAGVKPHLMVTDPPYGVDYDGTWRDHGPRQYPGHSKSSYVPNDNRADWSPAWALFSGDVAYVWHGLSSQTLDGFDLRAEIIWRKQQPIFGRGHYHWQHESCWYLVRRGKVASWSGDRRQSTIWDINTQVGWHSPEGRMSHGTQKPIECMKRPIENNSSAGQAVYDPFVGSGTTIIAAEMTGRACHAIEIAPQYVDVAIIRWQNFTGQQVTYVDGKTFDEMAAIRRPQQIAAIEPKAADRIARAVPG